MSVFKQYILLIAYGYIPEMDIESNRYHDETLVGELSNKQRTMKASSLFFLWFGSNLTVADFVLGVLIESYDLSIFYTIIALVIANVGGALLVAVMSYLGPKSGKGQMEISKGYFGERGGKAFSVLQFMNTIGWLSVNLIISARALEFVMTNKNSLSFSIFGVSAFEILALILVMVFISLTVIYGHRSIRAFEKVMSVILGIMYLFLALSIFLNPTHFISLYSGKFSVIAFASVIMLAFSYVMSWGPYAADYSRYVRKGITGEKASSMYTLLGAGLASFLVELIGFYVAIDLNLDGIFTNSLFVPLLGGLWFIGSMTLFLGGLSANALNIYSNLMSIRSLGFISARKYIITAVGILTIILGFIFYTDFSSYFEGFLYVLDYWITPWIGVMIGEFYIARNLRIFNGKMNWNPIVAYLLSIGFSIPFMDTIQYYFGLSIPLYGITSGVDYSYIISFALAILLTALFEKRCNLNRRRSVKTQAHSNVE